MLYCLIGESASGKTTIEEKLYIGGKADKVISYTSRPARNKEVNGYHYHFIEKEEFKDMIEEGFFTEHNIYRDWHYGTSLDGIPFEEKDYVVVCTPSGLKSFVKKYGRDYIRGVYIHTKERERIIRQLQRGDDVDEVMRRVKTDRKDFKDVRKICDTIIDNTHFSIDDTVSKILSYMGSQSRG